MSYITTVTGKHFDPMDPAEQEMDIYDIAHALSLICRGNGHIKSFYSVAQHSIACAEEAIARGCTWEVILGCLLHDASEAYLSDVTRPVKKELPQYLKAEEKLQNEIYKHFIGRELTEDERRKVIEIDDLMLSMEFHQLMPEELNGDYKNLLSDVKCEYQNPQEVRERFIQMAELDIMVEQTLEDEYWLIDIFPSQIPENEAESYYSVEREYLSGKKLRELYQKYADIMKLLNDRYDSALYCSSEDKWTYSPDAEKIESAVFGCTRGGCVDLLLPKQRTLLTLNARDLYLTVYDPDEELLSVLQNAVEEKGLYLWQHPRISRIKKNESYMCEAKRLLKAEKLTGEENKKLRFLIGELEKYYTGAEWRKDYESDDAGLLPKNLKRGVLSEDGIYDLLEEYKGNL